MTVPVPDHDEFEDQVCFLVLLISDSRACLAWFFVDKVIAEILRI